MTYVSHEWTPDSPEALSIEGESGKFARKSTHPRDGQRHAGTSTSISRAVGLAIVLRHFESLTRGPGAGPGEDNQKSLCIGAKTSASASG